MNDTWDERDQETGRHHRNAHLIELHGLWWVCLICHGHFDAAVDADARPCGN